MRARLDRNRESGGVGPTATRRVFKYMNTSHGPWPAPSLIDLRKTFHALRAHTQGLESSLQLRAVSRSVNRHLALEASSNAGSRLPDAHGLSATVTSVVTRCVQSRGDATQGGMCQHKRSKAHVSHLGRHEHSSSQVAPGRPPAGAMARNHSPCSAYSALKSVERYQAMNFFSPLSMLVLGA